MSDKILDIRNLTVDFKTLQSEVRAVSNVSFSVGIGETVGIVGESDSGKSATALAIMRLLPVLEGKVTAGEILFARENQDIGEPDNLVTVEENLAREHKLELRQAEASAPLFVRAKPVQNEGAE